MSHDVLKGPPNLRALTAFPTRHGKVNIPQEIGVNYQVFGVQLLDDPTGAKVENMEHKHGRDSPRINSEVLQEWLRGQGRRPVSWRTLIEVLKVVKLDTLAGDIEESCSAGVVDTEPLYPLRKTHQQTTLTSSQNISIAICILVAIMSLLVFLAIGYWPEKPLNGYMNVLKGTYQKQPVTDSDHWLHIVMPFIDLTLTERDIPPAREHIDYHMQDKHNLSLDEVVSSVKEGSKILIEGRPGVGKTTLLRHIAKQWAEGKNLQNFPLVVLVFLGHTPSSRITNLESMLEYHSHGYPDTASVARELGLTGGKGICFLLDALDEYLPQEGDFIYQLIKGQTLPNAAMIVTSRPNASYHLRPHFTRKIEVVGFLKHQIRQYISALHLKNATIISEYLHRHTNVKRISYLPLHLAMVTYLALHSEHISLLDLDTDTKIYHMFVNLTFRQRYKDVDDLDEIHNQAFSALSKIAFDATTRSGDYGASLRLHHLDPELWTRLESFSIISINKHHEGDKIHYTFTFSHNTFQEFFAAYYLTTLPHEEQMDVLEFHRYSPPLMWRFFFGLLRSRTSETTTKLFEKFVRIHIPTSRFARGTIMMCAYELKQTAVAEILVQALNYSITFEFLYPTLCTASAYVISLNPHQFKRLMIGFHLGSADYQEACLTSMLAELPESNEVVHVTLNELSLSDGTVSAVVKLLQYFPNLQRLELFNLGATAGVPFAKELEGLKHVRQVGIGIEGMTGRKFNATMLAEVLTHLPHLDHLSLRGVVAVKETVVATSLEHLTNLQHLDLSRNFMQADGAAAVAKVLKNAVNLQYLDLEYNDIGDDGAVAIAEGLKNAASLQTLKLRRNTIKYDGAVTLAEGIKHLTSLQVLELQDNEIADDGVAALAEGLKPLTSLQTLNLADNKIGDNGVVALTIGLSNLISLKKLILSVNEIGDIGAAKLAEGIECLTSLQVLELNWNKIGDDGIAALAEGIKHLTSLQVLELQSNKIGDDGVEALAEGLKHLTLLQTLHLGQNRIGDNGVVALTRGLKNLTSLKKLTLYYNEIGDIGAAKLAEEKHLSSLKELYLMGNKISEEEITKLDEARKIGWTGL